MRIHSDRAHLSEVLAAAHAHRGASFVEIYQNCVMFNDDAFAAVTGKDTRQHNQIRLRQGQPIVFGPDGERAVVAGPDGSMRIVLTPTGPTPIGIFGSVEAPVYDDLVRDQVARAKAATPADLRSLLEGGNVSDVG